MKFFASIALLGLILLIISSKTQNIDLGVTGMTMLIFGGFITMILAVKSNKNSNVDPSTNINITHNHYSGDGNRKK